MGYTLTDHQCGLKCSKGCSGPHCYCDGHTGGAAATVLCLPPAACAEACDALGDGCSGINVHFELPQCELIVGGCTDSTENEAWQFFAKTTGAACMHADDFKQTVGKITVTSRVHTSVEYVLTPGETSSLELTNPDGASFTYNGQLSRDRITVIDCGGSCGLSSPTDALSLPADSADIATWNSLVPFANFQDPAHEDTQNPPVPHKTKWGTKQDRVFTADRITYRVYTKQDRVFVPGANLVLAASTAICGSQAFCEFLCDSLEECGSIDMSAKSDRCFLNHISTPAHVDSFATDDSYMVLIPREDVNAEFPHASPFKSELPGKHIDQQDHGFSFDRLLRFGNITFKSGGTYKLCFCDASLVGGKCESEADYSVEVGTIHASGVSCLIQRPELQRVSCTEQYYGGLRCYKDMQAPMPVHPLLPLKPDLDNAPESRTPPSTSCLYGPEEEGCATEDEADS